MHRELRHLLEWRLLVDGELRDLLRRLLGCHRHAILAGRVLQPVSGVIRGRVVRAQMGHRDRAVRLRLTLECILMRRSGRGSLLQAELRVAVLGRLRLQRLIKLRWLLARTLNKFRR